MDVVERGLRVARRGAASGSQLLFEVLLARAHVAPGALTVTDRLAGSEATWPA
jgi:hypothetical protein